MIVSHDQRIKDIADRVLWLEDGRLTALAALPVDPVCGMAVERAEAPTAEWEGRQVTFCSTGCRSEFLADPARFLPANGTASGTD